MKTRSKKSLLCANCSSWISVGLCHSCDHKSIKEIFWQIKHLGFVFRMYSNGVLNINKYHKKVINGLLLFKLSVNFFVDSVADAKWLFWHILWVYFLLSALSFFGDFFTHHPKTVWCDLFPISVPIPISKQKNTNRGAGYTYPNKLLDIWSNLSTSWSNFAIKSWHGFRLHAKHEKVYSQSFTFSLSQYYKLDFLPQTLFRLLFLPRTLLV